MEFFGRSDPRGFTLIELLVVIAIIGVLASIIFASLSTARNQANDKTAIAQLHEIQTGIFLLENATGKSVGGCPIGVTTGTNNEIDIMASARAGLFTAPTDFTAYGPCQWSAGDIAKWHGPYIGSPLDPWGNHYYYDTDYYPREDAVGCVNPYPLGIPYTVAVSGGPNGQNGAVTTDYDCDDIFVLLLNQ